jgi:hypothetical protein
MFLCYVLANRRAGEIARCGDLLQRIGADLVPMLLSESLIDQYAASWALAWLGECGVWLPPLEPDVLERLWTLWHFSPNAEVVRVSAWAFGSLPLGQRDEGRLASVRDLRFVDVFNENLDFDNSVAALVAAWYVRLLPDAELSERANRAAGRFAKQNPGWKRRTFQTLLRNLGTSGDWILEGGD